MARDDDDDDPLGPARLLLVTALRLANKAAAADDHKGCYELLACAARLARKVKGLGEVADFRLERALDEAENAGDAEAQARELQSAFEGLLGDDDEPAEEPAVLADPLAAVQAFIGMAISIGAPAYNTGDHQGCYDVYACTARMALAAVPAAPPEARAKLTGALERAAALDDPNEQAWAMRNAFDAVGEMGGPALSNREVQLYLSLAIRLGAPAYNAGDHRGCFETYACAARFLVNAQAVPDATKEALRAALEQASTLQNVTRQAWVMREAFDALLPKAADPGAPDPPG
ncbi:HtrA protease/chaperone protein OS=Myxococcus stipitatus (strain DSM 14675 / JCM 12634 / Mx s8) GN=MYSTI_02778 PE=4 SV=1 [Gemmataceae bacterium]|nr:HtrA protease/chaperone protein OS=Myxococcus stipitatus (strain DSM 14675 / JCM 12634 / Mx s8) GN=MYSTI_02778 PE=4 SV=1 [Gemmataceae bacterium]VTU02838.1 HtrA protease/chaperone protein OS=Myxococcus stipitatus (strain DSM 14675 / JCM 12634 / Mx s8) GN=MYSTI_02778 PE=4 SV=1 [Gemmataceae bacterium]